MRLRLIVLMVGATACTLGEPCPALPCPLPAAINVTAKSKTTGTPVTVNLEVSGSETSSLSCQGSCTVPGNPGSYHLKASAAGYVTSETDVNVDGTLPGCGCPSVTPKSVTIVLTPTG